MLGIDRLIRAGRRMREPLLDLSAMLDECRTPDLPVRSLGMLIEGQIMCSHCGQSLPIRKYTPLKTSPCAHCRKPNFIPCRLQHYWLYAPLTSNSRFRVFRAVEESRPGTPLQIKLLPEGHGEDKLLITLMQREILIGSHLKDHPHFTRLLGYGLSNNQYFVVSEHIDGISMAAILASPCLVPQDRIILWALEILEAENALYERGYFYRNIQPKNILVGIDGNVRLSDYCLAERIEQAPRHKLQEDYQNTPSLICYNAPERIMGKAETPATEIYSLGMLLYRLLAKNLLLQDHLNSNTKTRIVPHLSLESMAEKMPDGTDQDLARIISKMIRYSPQQRFQNYDELRAELESAAGTSYTRAL